MDIGVRFRRGGFLQQPYHPRWVVCHAGCFRSRRHVERRTGTAVCFLKTHRTAVGAADAADNAVVGGKVRHHLPQRHLQREQVVRLQRQQKAILRQCAPHVRAQRPAALFCLVQPRAPLQLRRISPYPQQGMRTFQMDTGLRRLTLHRFAQRRARDEMVQ